MERQVLHVNVAHFKASLEELRNPELRGEPFLIASLIGRRSLLLDVSLRAFLEGIDRGESLKRSGRHRGMRIVSPDFNYYMRAEMDLRSILLPYAPVIESISRGHLFLDISGTGKVFGNPVDHAVRIKKIIYENMGIIPIVGLASNRLVSKVATRVIKPQGFISVMEGGERDFLAHQDVNILPGVGEKLAARMKFLGLRELGDIASLNDESVVSAFGQRGFHLRDCALGIDYTPVSPGSAAGRSFLVERFFEHDTNDLDELLSHLYVMSEDGGIELRKNGYSAGKVLLRIYYADLMESSGIHVMRFHTSLDRDLYLAAREIIMRIFTRRVRVSKMSIELSRLVPCESQMDLFVPEIDSRNRNLQKSIDHIRCKYGRDSICTGVSLNRKGA